MEVRSNKKQVYVPFGDLIEGTVFKHLGDYYMKFYKGNQMYNAVSLNGGGLLYLENSVSVIHIKGYFLMED